MRIDQAVSRPRVGVSVMPLENRHEVFVALATAADRLGYDGLFLPETMRPTTLTEHWPSWP